METKENNSSFSDLLSFDNSIDECFGGKHINNEDTDSFDYSKQLTENGMQLKSTPTKQMQNKITNQTNLFGFYNRLNQIENHTKQTVQTNMSSADKQLIIEEKTEVFDNSLGLSPVRKEFLKGFNRSYTIDKLLNQEIPKSKSNIVL